MARIHRLVYASRATFPPVRDGAGFHPEVGRVLIQSRRNNARRGLSGGLYFADGCFFQVLEGPRREVEALYARLHDDPRHRDLQVLAEREIEAPAFRGWAMKHVPDAPEVRALMARHGRVGFDPYAFTPELVDGMVELLLGARDPGVAAADDAPATRPALPIRLALAGTLAVAVLAAVAWLR